MNEADVLISKLQRYYQVGTLQALGEKIGVAQTTISGWSTRNSVKAISRKIYELNIPIEIEKDNIQSLEDEIERLQSLIDESYKLIIENIRFNLKPKLTNLFFEKQANNNLAWKYDIVTQNIFLKILDITREKSTFEIEKHKAKEFLLGTILDYRDNEMPKSIINQKENTKNIIAQNLSNLECYAIVKTPILIKHENLETIKFQTL